MGRNRSCNSLDFSSGKGDNIVAEEELSLEQLSKITFTFWKPIEISIDLTVEVPLR